MNCKDIMIGDFLTFKECLNDGIYSIIKVTSILEDTIFAQIDGDKASDELDYEDLTGIPLTPEILMKIGFEKNFNKLSGYYTANEIFGVMYIHREDEGFWQLYYKGQTKHIVPMEGKKQAIVRQECCFEINFLHELQHALKLFGINKKIEL